MTHRPTPEHEALCRRCGRCCYEKLIIEGRVFTTRTPCPHFDVKTRLCADYDHRHEVNSRCLTVAQGIEFGVFPADCPYVAKLKDYLPAEEGWMEEETLRKIERGRLFTAEQVRDDMRRCAARKSRTKSLDKQRPTRAE